MHDFFEHLFDIFARFGGHTRCFHTGKPYDILHFGGNALGVGGGQVDFVDHGHNFQIVVECQIGVGKRLRLNALGCIHNQNSALARGKTARNLVVKVHMTGGVNQIQGICIAVFCLVIEFDGVRLDRNAALALQIHIVEQLFFHIALHH